MSPKPKYDLEAKWDDPLDSEEDSQDRRGHHRNPADIKLQIAKDQGVGNKPLVAPGLVVDISLSGAQVKTKHTLSPGDEVDLAIPTGKDGKAAGLPKAFLSKALVLRVLPHHDDISLVACRFDSELRDDMEFALFVERVLELAAIQRQKNLQPDE